MSLVSDGAREETTSASMIEGRNQNLCHKPSQLWDTRGHRAKFRAVSSFRILSSWFIWAKQGHLLLRPQSSDYFVCWLGLFYKCFTYCIACVESSCTYVEFLKIPCFFFKWLLGYNIVSLLKYGHLAFLEVAFHHFLSFSQNLLLAKPRLHLGISLMKVLKSYIWSFCIKALAR